MWLFLCVLFLNANVLKLNERRLGAAITLFAAGVSAFAKWFPTFSFKRGSCCRFLAKHGLELSEPIQCHTVPYSLRCNAAGLETNWRQKIQVSEVNLHLTQF